MAFFESRFPVDVALGFTGGPMRRTNVVELASGREVRTGRWADSRRRYDASSGVKTLRDLRAVVDMWELAQGRLHGFRLRDWTDWRSGKATTPPTALDEPLGAGDGARVAFQLVKRYGVAGLATYDRAITKPVAESVLVAVGGVAQASGWSVNATTGVVTFDAAPAEGAAVTAGFDFDVPARFEEDSLVIRADLFDVVTGRALGQIPAIPLVEIRE